LDKEAITKILDINLSKLISRVEELGFKFSITESAKAFLAEKGFDADLGARPLARTIQKYVEDGIAEQLLLQQTGEGETIEVDYNKEANADELKITTIKKKERKKKDAPIDKTEE
jgi:ATP-dependent Clp protease ATP-binding subunit ClpC